MEDKGENLKGNAPQFSGRATSYAGSLEAIKDKEAWRVAYRATTEALERIRMLELANMTEEEARRRIASLTVCGTPWRERRDWSGLVEQQAIFHRRKKP